MAENSSELKDNLPDISEDELSLQEIYNHILAIIQLAKKKIWFVVFLVLLCGIIGFSYAFLQEDKYNASTSFILESFSGGMGQGTGMLNLVNQFGIGNNSSGISEKQLIGIAKSNTVLKNAILSSVKLNDTSAPLIKFMIEADSTEKPLINEYDFSKVPLAIKEERLIKNYSAKINNDLITVDKTEDGIIYIEILHTSEDLAKHLCENIVASLSRFFIDNAISKEKKIYNTLQHREDSIKKVLAYVEQEYSQEADASLRVFKYKGKLGEKRLEREVKILSSMYIEVVKNLEVAKFNLMNKTPVIQIVDTPEFPLPLYHSSQLKFSLAGIILGCILSFFLSISLYLYQVILIRLKK